ncbi:MAG: sugar-binding transcriptional regulator [Kiloniellales bacterium]
MHGLVQPDGDLSVRAAWLSLAGGLTQEQIAERLGVSRVKVARLIARAQREGRIKVFVEGSVTACLELEDSLCARFGLSGCHVAPSIDDDPLPLRVLGPAGAQALQQVLEREEITVIGVGHGRTLAAAVQALPWTSRPDLRFVALLGSLTRSAATNPFDVIARLADKSGGTGYYMPAPFRCDSEEDRAVFLGQRTLRQVFDLARLAQVMVVGVGAVQRDSHMVQSDVLTAEEHDEVVRCGACGELLGTFIDADGRPVDTQVNQRCIALPLESLAGKEVILLAGGHGKARAARSALKTGLIRQLITDEATARRIVELGV